VSVTSEQSKRAGRIPEAVAYSGISRWALYKLAMQHPQLFRKIGRSTLVDFEILDGIIDGLEAARINIST
jgi:hypothetical protein